MFNLHQVEKSKCVMNKLDETHLILEISGKCSKDAGEIDRLLSKKFRISRNPEKVNGIVKTSSEIVVALEEAPDKKMIQDIISELIYG